MEIPLKLPKLRERFFKNTTSTLRKVLFFDRFRRVEGYFSTKFCFEPAKLQKFWTV